MFFLRYDQYTFHVGNNLSEGDSNVHIYKIESSLIWAKTKRIVWEWKFIFITISELVQKSIQREMILLQYQCFFYVVSPIKLIDLVIFI